MVDPVSSIQTLDYEHVETFWTLSDFVTLSLSKLTKEKIQQNDKFSICETWKKHIVPCGSTVKEVSFGHTFAIVLVPGGRHI